MRSWEEISGNIKHCGDAASVNVSQASVVLVTSSCSDNLDWIACKQWQIHDRSWCWLFWIDPWSSQMMQCGHHLLVMGKEALMELFSTGAIALIGMAPSCPDLLLWQASPISITTTVGAFQQMNLRGTQIFRPLYLPHGLLSIDTKRWPSQLRIVPAVQQMKSKAS